MRSYVADFSRHLALKVTALPESFPAAKSARASSVVAPAAFGHRGGGAVVCFSHLRWDFVFQRPQHLMSRFARTRRVVVWEEPTASEPGAPADVYTRTDPATGVTVATPRLPQVAGAEAEAAITELLTGFLADQRIEKPVAWYYTPMMLGFSRAVAADAACVVYDCMDELSNFRNAPERLRDLERELVDAADVVFTGGWSLYEAKRAWHGNIHPFPSSVDRAHFARARTLAEPVSSADRVGPVALDLLRRFGMPRPVRLLGVRGAGLQNAAADAATQLSLAL